jgi:glycosyltransferase involved in cell wall biosynthesis
MNPYLSVIIPTYSRRPRLAACLEALKQQTLAQSAFEVIVVNDGSTDDTQVYLDEVAASWPQLRVIHQENTGQGLARNHALKFARGQVLLFIGDDIYAEPDFLEMHVDFHQKNPAQNYSCLGLTEWYNESAISEFMQWLTNGGPQFSYKNLNAGDETDFWHFYTSNISLKTELLAEEHFDKRFEGYGWEDIELAYRLKKRFDLKLIYQPEAKAFHDDPMEFSQLRTRMHKVAINAAIFENIHPELQVNPRGIKKLIFLLISRSPSLLCLKLASFFVPPLKRMYWYASMKRYYLEGMAMID